MRKRTLLAVSKNIQRTTVTGNSMIFKAAWQTENQLFVQ